MKSKLFLSSMSTIIGLFGILILFLILVFTALGIELQWLLISSIVFLTVQFLIAPYITDWIMRGLYKARFDATMPDYVTEFVKEVCKEHNMKYPKMGYIDDGNPNAFTYGRTKNDARIVVTRGLFDVLTPEEVKTVVAHEIGHAVHYDMFFMTVAQIVPLVLRWIYEITVRGGVNNSDSDGNGNGKLALFGMIAFVLHIIAQYVILWFSRMRELYADEFAVRVTKNPAGMGNALVKIGYGLVTTDEVFEDKTEDELISEILAYSEENKLKLKEKNLRKMTLPELRIMLADFKKSPKIDISSVSALGIFDAKTSKNLALARCCNSSEMETDRIKMAARWDLWNPWATWFEIHSTHPRISKRLNAISKMSSSYNQQPFIVFDEPKDKSYAPNFMREVFINFFPLLIILGTIGAIFMNIDNDGYISLSIGIGLFLMGISYILKLRRGYPNSNYTETNVATLLGEVNVSHVTGIPVILKGTFIGRGSPGFIFSEDFVLRDETGIVFIDYNQPLSIMNFFFGLFKAQKYLDKEVTIKGWYKRGPIPYVELYQMHVDGETKTCYTFGFKKFLTGFFLGLGALLTFAGLFTIF